MRNHVSIVVMRLLVSRITISSIKTKEREYANYP